jgi:S1-C subfamily serine protease
MQPAQYRKGSLRKQSKTRRFNKILRHPKTLTDANRMVKAVSIPVTEEESNQMLNKTWLSVACAVVLTAIPAVAQQSGWLGVSIGDQKDGGAIVRSVELNSPAERAGLKQSDVIVEYNKENVLGVQQLTRLIRETPVGRTVEMKIRRDNRDQTLQVTTEASRFPDALGNIRVDLPNVGVIVDQARRTVPRVQVSTTFVQSGIRVEQMTDQLRDFFGVFTNLGVLVSSVDAGSSAEKAGLKPGDVITAVDGRSVRNPSDFSREMRAANGKGMLKIVRDKQERELKLE